MSHTVTQFIHRWKKSGGSEQANSQLFLTELCDILGVEHPAPATPDNEANAYAFERKISVPNLTGGATTKRLDLYRKDCFVLESKQGQEREETGPTAPAGTRSTAVSRSSRQWEETMLRAQRQAVNYVRGLPSSRESIVTEYQITENRI